MTDWKARAEREAAAILDETGYNNPGSRDLLISLLAIGWLQGVNFGSHDFLNTVEDAFDALRARL